LDRAAVDALRRIHDRLRRIVNNDIPASWRKGAVQKALAADPALKATLEATKKRIERAVDPAGKTEQAYKDLVGGKPTIADPDKMQAMYDGHLPHAEQLKERLADLVKNPTQLAAEAERVRKQIRSARDRAVTVLAAGPVQGVLGLDSFKGLRTNSTRS